MNQGGINKIQSSLETSKRYAVEAEQTLRQCRTILKEEEDLDASTRAKYGNQWSLPESHLANSKFFQDINKYEGNLSHAQKSDAIILSKFQRVQPILQKLSGSEVGNFK